MSNPVKEKSPDISPNIRMIDVNNHGQRVDNYLIKVMKGVPKTRIYKAVRSGEVRVNGSRVKVSRKLSEGDKVRVPPIRVSQGKHDVVIPPKLMDSIPIIFEDDHLIIVNKPSGLAVHAGSGMAYGLIEAFRHHRSELSFIELVHRLDRETSGCLMLAKSRGALLGLQSQLSKDRTIGKSYQALVEGNWQVQSERIDYALMKSRDSNSAKKMHVDRDGQPATSVVSMLGQFDNTTLIGIELKTGRMHQARVHCAESGHPIAGDRMYGDRGFNRQMKKLGLGRLFLHAHKLAVCHPESGDSLVFEAPLPDRLRAILEKLGYDL